MRRFLLLLLGMTLCSCGHIASVYDDVEPCSCGHLLLDHDADNDYDCLLCECESFHPPD